MPPPPPGQRIRRRSMIGGERARARISDLGPCRRAQPCQRHSRKLMNPSRRFLRLGIALAVLWMMGSRPADTRADFLLSNNLGTSTGGTEIATGDSWLAAGFGTDASSYKLTSVTLLLARTSIGGSAEVDV